MNIQEVKLVRSEFEQTLVGERDTLRSVQSRFTIYIYVRAP